MEAETQSTCCPIEPKELVEWFRTGVRQIVLQAIERERSEGPGAALAFIDARLAVMDIRDRARQSGAEATSN